jgi:hypothetical protein
MFLRANACALAKKGKRVKKKATKAKDDVSTSLLFISFKAQAKSKWPQLLHTINLGVSPTGIYDLQ